MNKRMPIIERIYVILNKLNFVFNINNVLSISIIVYFRWYTL